MTNSIKRDIITTMISKKRGKPREKPSRKGTDMTPKNTETPAGRDFEALYRGFGYKRFRMSRFEEYSLYAENQNFLVSERVITFNDPRGRLMALKPDVTLSIAKSFSDTDGVRKYYYDENVFRTDEGSGEFREINQTGLECMGRLDDYSVCEVLSLAARSLDMISPRNVLDLSDINVLTALFDDAGFGEKARKKAFGYFAAKNAHALRALYAECGVPAGKGDAAAEVALMYGRPDELLPRLRAILPASAAETLDGLGSTASNLALMDADKALRLDFSIVNDMSYYNGIIFRGFVDGNPRTVLSGGRYDNLMSRLGKKGQAIGFAIYLDALAELEAQSDRDVDTLLLYGDRDDPADVIRAAAKLTAGGEKIRVSREKPEDISYSHVRRLINGEVCDCE